jgi:diacylglycerol kinase family enzyme
LIISASGDGGYHDVINGALQAQTEGARPVCAVLPAGNANDHARVMHPSVLSSSIVRGKIRQIDVLKMSSYRDEWTHERYSHSYIGFGLSPAIAVELNKSDLNIFKEIAIVGRNILANRSFTVVLNGKDVSLDSLIVSNIGEMAKILKLSKKAQPDDGFFEVNIFPHRGKSYLLRRLWRATRGIDEAKQLKTFSFTLAKSTVVQLDGEVLQLQGATVVKINAEYKLLTTLA